LHGASAMPWRERDVPPLPQEWPLLLRELEAYAAPPDAAAARGKIISSAHDVRRAGGDIVAHIVQMLESIAYEGTRAESAWARQVLSVHSMAR
jgi:hypothetical protein